MWKFSALAYFTVIVSFPLLLLQVCAAGPSPPVLLPTDGDAADLKDQQPGGEALLRDADYNLARYGRYVNQTFKSSNVSALRFNVMKPFTGCDDGSYIFVTPRGEVVQHPAAFIYDANGSLIWTPYHDFGEVYNLQVQTYNDESFLTFWAGNNSGGHGDGFHYMFDQHYNLSWKIGAGNGLGADLHSFSILPSGKALMTVYEMITPDMAEIPEPTPMRQKFVWDCLFQEVEIETGNVTFQWRASNHFDMRESFSSHQRSVDKKSWDWFHINMVEKDVDGNYLISIRHLRCIAYISGETGEVLWQLGGKNNMFRDLSHGAATSFIGQHDAHWDEYSKSITLFDNRADWQDEAEHLSRGKKIEINISNMTARLVQDFVHPEKIAAFSQGSFQTLPNKNVLLGYGYSGAISEYSPNGTLLCDAYLQPLSRFSSGDVQSYRNLKFNWTGIPKTEPSMVIEDGVLYVSWLGSTEVRRWWLQETHAEDGRLGSLWKFDKTGFETLAEISANTTLRRYLRVVALDKDDRPLKASSLVDIGNLATVHEAVPKSEAIPESAEQSTGSKLENGFHTSVAKLGFAILAVFVLLVSFRPRILQRLLPRAERDPGLVVTDSKAGLAAQVYRRLRDFRFKSRYASLAYDRLPRGSLDFLYGRRESAVDDG